MDHLDIADFTDIEIPASVQNVHLRSPAHNNLPHHSLPETEGLIAAFAEKRLSKRPKDPVNRSTPEAIEENDPPPDEPSVPRERSMSKPVNEDLLNMLRSQHQSMQHFIRCWTRRQEDVLTSLLSEMESHANESAGTDPERQISQAESAMLEITPCARKPSAVVVNVSDFEGMWIDRLGWFNGGAPFKISESSSPPGSPLRGPSKESKRGFRDDSKKSFNSYNSTPKFQSGKSITQFSVRKVDSQWRLYLSKSDGREEHFELDLATRDTLIVRYAETGSQITLQRTYPTERYESDKQIGNRFRSGNTGISDNSQDSSMNMLRSYVIKSLNLDPAEESFKSMTCIGKVRRLSHVLSLRLEKPPRKRTGRMAWLVHSKRFEITSSLVIMANAITIGFSADYSMKHIGEPPNQTLEDLELVWSAFYFAELLMRVWVHRLDYIFSNEWKWNLFDMVLVVLAINDQIIAMMENDSESRANFSVVRVLRMAKMLKLLRMVRLMRMFRQLRLILNSIMGSINSMFWSIVLILVITGCLGICFVQAATEELRQNSDVVVDEELDEWWGSVPKAMISMYMASFGGEDWRKIAEPLEGLSSGFFYGVFLLYIGFFHCVIANTLTSLFVEATISNADTDHQQLIMLELENKDKYIKMLSSWFKSIADGETRQVSMDTFTQQLHRPEMFAFASRMGIEITDIRQFFAVLTSNGTKPVDLETFVIGCIKLKGPAKSMDLMDLMFAHRMLISQHHEFTRYCEGEFKAIRKHLRDSGLWYSEMSSA